MPSLNIYCPRCGAEPAPHYPGEWFKQVAGTALRDFVCDVCGAAIPQDSRCFAVSYGKNRTPYSPWEDSFILEDQ